MASSGETSLTLTVVESNQESAGNSNGDVMVARLNRAVEDHILHRSGGRCISPRAPGFAITGNMKTIMALYTQGNQATDRSPPICGNPHGIDCRNPL